MPAINQNIGATCMTDIDCPVLPFWGVKMACFGIPYVLAWAVDFSGLSLHPLNLNGRLVI